MTAEDVTPFGLQVALADALKASGVFWVHAQETDGDEPRLTVSFDPSGHDLDHGFWFTLRAEGLRNG